MSKVARLDDREFDARVRTEAFRFLERQQQIYPDALPFTVLQQGFRFEGTRVPLIGPQGIFKPKILSDMPLSFYTAPIEEGKPPPYDDKVGDDGLMRYKYRGTNPEHRDNVGMRLAMQRRVPLIYLFGLVPGRYVAVWPVFVVGDDPARLDFMVAVDDKRAIASLAESFVAEPADQARRIYVTTTAQRRLHQQSFRERVLTAYRQCCAICRLRHLELLDAAHILPDGHPRGEPWVSNGLSLCKLHHAAFDRNLLGIRRDLVVEVRRDILDEEDGPMLIHGIQDCHNRPLAMVPSAKTLRPNPEYLEERYEEFLRAV